MRGVLLSFVLALSSVSHVAADGPWAGSVVDAESRRRVSDAVVIAVWLKRFPALMHQGQALHDVVEVVTDADGGFVIPAQRRFTLIPFVRVDGPDVRIFKAGFNGWRFAGEPPIHGAANVMERDAWIAAAWRRFGTVGEEIELVPARTWQERRRAFTLATPPGDIPDKRIPRYREALKEEAKWLAAHWGSGT